MTFLKKENVDYVVNFYRYKLYDNKKGQYLISCDAGDFLFLDKISFKFLKKGQVVSKKLYKVLLDKSIIVDLSNIDDLILKTSRKYGFLSAGTSLHIVIPTHRCNLGCVYCFASSIPKNVENPGLYDLSYQRAKQTVEFILNSPSYAITIEFQGGEPLVRFDIVKYMIEYAKELNLKYKKDLKFIIVSNFTLLNDSIVSFLIDNLVSICTSLDGPKEVHDKNRSFLSDKNKQKVGSFDVVVYWIDRINLEYKRRGINQKVGAVLTTTFYSLKFYKQIIDTYIGLGLELISIRSLTRIGKAKEDSVRAKHNFLYSREEFESFYLNCLDYINELKSKNVLIDDVYSNLFEQKILTGLPQYNTEFESPCGAAIMQILYHTTGDIYTCNEAIGRDEFKLGNVFCSWDDIFKKKQVAKTILNSMLEQNVICDRCVYKPFCSTCMVENFYTQNKFNFNPYKTKKHFETIFLCNRVFDKLLKQNLK